MSSVTLLGPIGATFSYEAYRYFADRFDAPREYECELLPVPTNGYILESVLKTRSYGVIAMETKAEARIDESLDSFFTLLRAFDTHRSCPIHIIGSVALPIKFHLMARDGVSKSEIDQVIAHPKSFGACRNNVGALGVPTVSELSSGIAISNGLAAEMVATNPLYAKSAALAPLSASIKYRLNVLEKEFEDEEAVTTFFLIGPTEHQAIVGKTNKVLVMFVLKDEPSAFTKVLEPFAQWNLNLTQVHSVNAGNGTRHFLVESVFESCDAPKYEEAVKQLDTVVMRRMSFGPFILG